MGSTFSGLNTAYSALVAQRRALEVTGQNIANVNTPGYTRQRATMESQGAPAVPALHSRYEGAGDGVKVTDIERITDTFLVNRQQAERGKLGAAEERSATLKRIEDVLTEPSDTGIADALDNVFDGLDNVAKGTDNAPRAALLASAGALTDDLNDASASLDADWRNLHGNLTTVVEEVNTAAASISELNLAIRRDVQSGIPANELLDRRDALVLKLSDLVGATAKQRENGMVDVVVGTTALVSGISASKIAVAGTTDPRTAGDGSVQIVTSPGGTAVDVPNGKAGGTLDSLNVLIPKHSARLDAFAQSLADAFNPAHQAGYDAAGAPGKPFFVNGTGIGPVTAGTIRLGLGGPGEVAASAYSGANVDTSNAGKMAKIREQVGGPSANYRELVTDLGVESQTATRRLDTQSDVSQKADSAVLSTSGVDTDEEMTNLLAFQRGYEAAARVMATIDGMLDTLINRTGVGN